MEFLDQLKQERFENHQEVINLLDETLSQIETKIETIPDNIAINRIKKNRLTAHNNRLKKIKEILTDVLCNYKIVFIGTIGVGKTTAICHLFDLTQETNTLLSTGSGRTTICMVAISSGEKTQIKIEPINKDEIETKIRQFLESFIEEDSYNPLTKEYERLIRNFIRKQETYTKMSILDKKTKRTKTSTVITDPLKEEGKQTKEQIQELERQIERIKSNSLENEGNLIQELEKQIEEIKKNWCNQYIQAANLKERICKEIIYNPEVDINEKVWIEKNFKEINEGTNPNFSLPRKISVILSKENYPLLSYFGTIVDSKGLEKNDSAREDIDKILSKDEHAIGLFMTSFNDAPEEPIRKLIHSYLVEESRMYHQRFGILALPQSDQPNKENGADGEWDKGIEIKRKIIYENIKQRVKEEPQGNAKSFEFK